MNKKGTASCLLRARADDQAIVALSECSYKGEAQGWWDRRRGPNPDLKASRRSALNSGLDSEED